MSLNKAFLQGAFDYYSDKLSQIKSPQRKLNQTIAYTPTSFSQKNTNRRQQIKNTIKQCIYQISNKQKINTQGFLQAKKLNQQLLESLSTQSLEKYCKTSKIADKDYRLPQYTTEYLQRSDLNQQKQRSQVTLSQFTVYPTQSPYCNSNFSTSQIYRPYQLMSNPSITNQQEIWDMKERIRSQRIKNKKLQGEIQTLRRQLSQLSVLGRNFSSGEYSYLLDENIMLKRALNKINSQQNINGILQEFRRLKEDNEKLKKETIHLLKSMSC